MRKKILYMFVLGMIVTVSAGCAEPETENTTDSVQEENMPDTNALQKEQGRSVVCTLETPEEMPDIEIQATVIVPETIIEEGEFEYSLPSVELIEEVLTNGEKMEKDTSDAWNDTWCILSEKDSEPTYQKYYSVDLTHHYAWFADQTIQNVVGEATYTDETCPDETTAEKMQELTEQVMSFFKKTGMDVCFLNRDIEIENGRYMAYVDVVSVIDDIPLVSTNYGYVKSYSFIMEEGVSTMYFSGFFAKKNAQEVSVISVDELLDILKVKAKEGEIDSWGTITGITLVYCVDYNTQTFHPVWCLYGDTVEGMDIIINAQTGECVPYSNGNVWYEGI